MCWAIFCKAHARAREERDKRSSAGPPPDPLTSDFYLNPTCSHNLLKVWFLQADLNFGTKCIFGKVEFWEHNFFFAKVIFVSLSFSKRALDNWAESDPDPMRARQGREIVLTAVPPTPLTRLFHPLQWAFSPHFASTLSTLLLHHDLDLTPRPPTPRPGHAFTGCQKIMIGWWLNLYNAGRRRSW